MTISDISTIRVNVWKDMKEDLLSVANADFTYNNLADYDGPGDGLGFNNNGTGRFARAASYNPTFGTQGTFICRMRMLFGSGNKVWLAFNGSGVRLGFSGSSFMINNFSPNVPCFTDTADTWRIVAGTWGPAGVKTYDQGSPFSSNASTAYPNGSLYGLSIGGGFGGAGNGTFYNNLNNLKLDWAALLNRQLSDAEVADLSTTPSQLWSGGGGGSSAPPGHAFNNGSGYSGNRRAFVAGGLNLGGF